MKLLLGLNPWLLLSVALGGMLILAAEYLRRRKIINSEATRKIMHAAHALTVATWPFFVGYTFIVAAEAIFVAIVILARELRLFHELRNVKRSSWGEIFFGLGIIILALLKPSPMVFCASLLHLGLADAMASIVGQRIKSKAYRVFGQHKTVAGTAAFAITSITIIASLTLFSDMDFTRNSYVASLLLFPLLTALAENFSPYGSDNLTVPLTAAGLFSVLGF